MMNKKYRLIEKHKVFFIVDENMVVFCEFDYQSYLPFFSYTQEQCYKNAIRILNFLNDEC